MKQLLSSLFSFNPSERLSLAEVVAHEWVSEEVPSHIIVMKEMQRRQDVHRQAMGIEKEKQRSFVEAKKVAKKIGPTAKGKCE